MTKPSVIKNKKPSSVIKIKQRTYNYRDLKRKPQTLAETHMYQLNISIDNKTSRRRVIRFSFCQVIEQKNCCGGANLESE